MRRKDWAGTVVVACLVGAAGLLHDHTIALAVLLGAAAVGVVVIAWDVLRRPPKRPAGRLRVLTPSSSVRILRTTSSQDVRGREAELSQRRVEERRAREQDGGT